MSDGKQCITPSCVRTAEIGLSHCWPCRSNGGGQKPKTALPGLSEGASSGPKIVSQRYVPPEDLEPTDDELSEMENGFSAPKKEKKEPGGDRTICQIEGCDEAVRRTPMGTWASRCANHWKSSAGKPLKKEPPQLAPRPAPLPLPMPPPPPRPIPFTSAPVTAAHVTGPVNNIATPVKQPVANTAPVLPRVEPPPKPMQTLPVPVNAPAVVTGRPSSLCEESLSKIMSLAKQMHALIEMMPKESVDGIRMEFILRRDGRVEPGKIGYEGVAV